MLTMECLILFLLHNFLLQTAECINLRKKWLRWDEINVTFGDKIHSIESVSLTMCLAKCQETSSCAAVNVNEANSQCELSAYYPLDRTKSATPRTGWTVYFKDSIEVRGSQAWQSSTYADCDADNAIDGKLDEYVCPTLFSCGCRCAHTNSQTSTWVMELKTPGYVKTVALYFRVGTAHTVWRNTDFCIFVHNSFEDAKNGLTGTLCMNYTGAWITSEIRLSCPQAIYGKAVRIFKDSDEFTDLIQLCEVKVFFV